MKNERPSQAEILSKFLSLSVTHDDGSARELEHIESVISPLVQYYNRDLRQYPPSDIEASLLAALTDLAELNPWAALMLVTSEAKARMRKTSTYSFSLETISHVIDQNFLRLGREAAAVAPGADLTTAQARDSRSPLEVPRSKSPTVARPRNSSHGSADSAQGAG